MLFCKNRYGILCIIYLNFILLAVSAAFQNKNRKIESEQSLERRGVFCAPVIADRKLKSRIVSRNADYDSV